MFIRIFFIVVLLTPVCYLKSMNLDDLPAGVIGKTVVQLMETVGTLAIKNEADIPVIVKYVKGLSLVNKELYKKCNKIKPVSMFIEALSKRFGMNELTAIGHIKMPGGNELLKNYIEETGEYEQFKSLQHIFDIAEQVSAEFEPFGFKINCKKDFSCVLPALNQTKQGFFISCTDGTPNSLRTPWGRVAFLGGASGFCCTFQAFYQSLFKRFTTSLVWVASERPVILESQETDLKTWFRLGEKMKDFPEGFFKKISNDELDACREKNMIVFNGDALYRVHAVDECQLPFPKMFFGNNCRSENTIKLIWNILQERYNQEKGIVVT